MSIFEYDEEKEMKIIREDIREMVRDEALEEGREQGLAQGLRQGNERIKESIKSFILVNLEEQTPEERIIENLQKIFGVLPEEGSQLISLYREAE